MILSSGDALTGQANDFNISIDQRTWAKWGFEYPVTYVFHVSDASPQTTVLRPDSDSEPWKPLERKTSSVVNCWTGTRAVHVDVPFAGIIVQRTRPATLRAGTSQGSEVPEVPQDVFHGDLATECGQVDGFTLAVLRLV